ncbi:MAG TPA: response regulator [Burkholderiales bacterium]
MPSGKNLTKAASSQAAPPRVRRVLIVDDDRDTVLTLSALLREEGYETKGVYDGHEAIRAVDDFDPDAVLLDIAMPGMTGWDVARQIRSSRPSGEKRPFLIGISGEYTKSADRILGEIAGFQHYFYKPFDPKLLLTLLAKLN